MEQKHHLVAWASVTNSLARGGLGVRSMRELNSVSMEKLGWRMIHEPDAMWVRVLKHRYCKGSLGIDMFTRCRNPSNLWKGISESKPILQKGMAYSIGDG